MSILTFIAVRTNHVYFWYYQGSEHWWNRRLWWGKVGS